MAEDRFRVVRSPVPLPDDLAADEQPFAPYPNAGQKGPLVPGSGYGPGYSQPEGISNYVKTLRGTFLQMPFTVGTTAIQLLPEEPQRSYLFLLNYSAANQIFVGFDTLPIANANGVTLAVNLGFYEPWIIPTNPIYVLASAAGTQGLLIRVLHK